MKQDQELTAVQLDALLEIANIGSGHAATVLSKMSNTPIMISTPELFVTKLSDVAERLREKKEPLVATAAQILGDLSGHVVFVLSAARAAKLCSMLLPGVSEVDSLDSELAQSSLKELGNILGSSFMNALADFMGMVLYPSVPTLTVDPPSAFAEGLGLGPESDLALYIRTGFLRLGEHSDEKAIGESDYPAGVLLFLPTEKSLEKIFTAINVA